MIIIEYIKNTWTQFSDDDGFMMAGALAYYTLFSIAPLLVIVIFIFGYFIDSNNLEDSLFQQLGSVMGYNQAKELQTIVDNARETSSGVIATIISGATLLISSTAVVIQLKDALNKSWNVIKDPKLGFKSIVIDRVLSFGFLLGIGFIFLVSMGLNTIATQLSDQVSNLLPAIGETAVIVVSTTVDLFITATMFLLLFKTLPDAKLHNKDLIIGALMTTLLFTIGRYLIGIYLGNSNISSTFGGAGALASFMVWVYYNAIILILGAEFTQVYASANNRRIKPTDQSVKVERVIKRKSTGDEL
jgi:membrane protein